MAFDVGSVVAKVTADISGFEQGMRQVEKQTQSVSNKMVSASKKMAVGLGVVGAAAGALSYKSILLASDVEEMTGKFNVVFSETGPKVRQELNDFADAVGRNRYELQGMAADFGDTLKPMGFVEQEAASLSVDLVKLATDLGSFNNLSMDEALRRLQGTLIGSHENALKFGVVINENTLKAQMLEDGTADLTGAQFEQAKVQARINLLMAGTSDAQGDAARTADSYANRVRALQAKVQELQVALGEKLLPIATRFVNFLVETAIPKLSELATFLVENKDAVIAVGIGVAAMLVPAFVSWAIAAGVAAVATIAATWPLIVLGAAVAAAAYLIIKNWDWIMEKTEGLRTFLRNVFTWIYNFLVGGSIIPELVNAMIGLFNRLWSFLTNMLESTRNFFVNTWSKIKQAVVNSAENIKNSVSNSFSRMVGAIRSAGSRLYDAMTRPFTRAKEKIGETVEWIKSKLDFTQRHSPSVVDIVERGVGKVNKALGGLDFGLNATNMATASVTNNTMGPGINNIIVNLDGAMVGSLGDADELAERIGDGIMRRLQMNVRF